MSVTSTETSIRRFFTVEEANALLPRIRPLIDQLQDQVVKIREAVSSLQEETGLEPDDPALEDAIRNRHRIADLVAGAQELVDEIHQEGALVNGPEEGLVDFPAVLDGELIFLCWKCGEPAVAHWHRIPDGFEGRRPLLDEAEPGDGDRPATIH